MNKIKIKNRGAATVIYTVPEMNMRREFSPGEIKEIAYELGFDNPNYFSRLFKKQENMSPSSRRGIINTYDKTIKKERK